MPWHKYRVLDDAIYVEAHPANFNQMPRPIASIEYIVVHYTGNIGDTARNNAMYFRETVTQTSAHLFVSEDTIYQSVPFNHSAYAVGLGSRKEPWIKWPSMWKKITNSNSISVELCGSYNSREASDVTKRTGAMLVADLLDKFNLTPGRVFRHYDVTGKECPAWAVKDPLKWLDFTLTVSNIFYGKGEDNLLNNEENYSVFKQFMDRYFRELDQVPADWETDAMKYCEIRGLIKDGRPKSLITRGELATVLMRMNA